MDEKAARVMEVATSCGYELTPAAMAMAIRAAVLECSDEAGRLNIPSLYELTLKLESQPHYSLWLCLKLFIIHSYLLYP